MGGVVRVLVVEDDAPLSREVATGLRHDGIAVDVAFDGAEALEKAAINAYDVVVLDRDLPVVHGDEVCRRIAESDALARVIMLTASGTLDDRVDGLGLGADDYLTKPFAMRELVARVRALGRRTAPGVAPILTVGDLRIDVARHRVDRADRECKLTPKEFGVLELLAQDPGRVVSAEELLEKVWDEFADPFTNAVRVTMVTLRRKLGDPPIVETVKGVGYRVVTK
jgi:DNA-binding response OmpR family regulator